MKIYSLESLGEKKSEEKFGEEFRRFKIREGKSEGNFGNWVLQLQNNMTLR